MDLASQALWPLLPTSVGRAGNDFVLGLAAEPKAPDAHVLCVPTSGPSPMSSSWLVASLTLVWLALILGDLD